MNRLRMTTVPARDIRDALAEGIRHQKQVYDQKVHGDPYTKGDLVWLHSPVVPKGASRKLHHPWTGPYQVLDRVNDCSYRIRLISRRKPQIVVHFNRLKTRIEKYGTRNSNRYGLRLNTNSDPLLGTRLLVLEDVDTDSDDADTDANRESPTAPQRCYPCLHRHPLVRLPPCGCSQR